MIEIDQAIAAFESNPTDENAQGVSLATMTAASIAFINISDGIFPQQELLERLERAHAVLATVNNATDVVRKSAANILFRHALLKERSSGNHAEVSRMLREALAA